MATSLSFFEPGIVILREGRTKESLFDSILDEDGDDATLAVEAASAAALDEGEEAILGGETVAALDEEEEAALDEEVVAALDGEAVAALDEEAEAVLDVAFVIVTFLILKETFF